jgi:hypothetical protein
MTRIARGRGIPTLPSTQPAIPDGEDRMVDTDGAAHILDVPSKWLVKGRNPKKPYGPPFIKLGPRFVRYSVRALLAWAAANTVAGGPS